MVCRSVGWLVYDGKDCKLIVPHLSEPDQLNAKQQGCGDMAVRILELVKLLNFDLRSVNATSSLVRLGLAGLQAQRQRPV